MNQMIEVKKISRWQDYNEYEGQLDIQINGADFTCYILMHSSDEWKTISQKKAFQGRIWLERTGQIDIVETDNEPYFRQIKGVNYEILGSILEQEGEHIIVKSTIPIDLAVDLDVTADMQDILVRLFKGTQVKVTGVLKVELF